MTEFCHSVTRHQTKLSPFSPLKRNSRVSRRYHTKITPGCVVAVLEPRIKTLSDSDNVFISSGKPRVPVANVDISFPELPPFDVENESDFGFFQFNSSSTELKFAKPTLDLPYVRGQSVQGNGLKTQLRMHGERRLRNLGSQGPCQRRNTLA